MRVTATAPRGITARPLRGGRPVASLALGTLARNAVRTVRVRITRPTAATPAGAVMVTARAGRVRAAKAIPVGVTIRPGTTPPAAGSPAPPKAVSLTGRYFWAAYTKIFNQTGIQVVWFASPTHAYVASDGLPADGPMPTCAGGQPAPASETADGCVPYSFEPASNTLTLRGVAVPFDPSGHTFTYLSRPMGEAAPATVGARWDVSLTHMNTYGLFPNFSVVRRYLTLGADGRFVTASLVQGSSWDSNWASASPDSRGTYAVEAPGLMTLRYDNGTVEQQSLAVSINDQGQSDIGRMGVLLGARWFWGPTLLS